MTVNVMRGVRGRMALLVMAMVAALVALTGLAGSARAGTLVTAPGLPMPSDQMTDFGSSVALSADGRTAVVGAPNANAPSDPARTFLFTEANGTWSQSGTFWTTAYTPGFGSSVAVDGNTVAVGAPAADEVLLFERNADGTWPHTASDTISGPFLDQMGASVALSGHMLAAGSRVSGHAYLYDISDPSNPQLTATVTGTPGSFGTGLALSGTTLAVGSPSQDAVDEYDISNPASPAPTSPVTGTAGSNFGTSVGLNGTTLAVGAPGDNGGDGAVDLFAAGQAGQTLTPDAHGTGFGRAVALGGGAMTLLAGEPGTAPGAVARFATQTTLIPTVLNAATGQAWAQPQPPQTPSTATAQLAPATADPGPVTYTFYSSPGCTGAPIAQSAAVIGTDSPPTSGLAPGTYSVQAGYPGDADVAPPATACASFTVAPPRQVSLAAGANPTTATYGNTVILSATGPAPDATGTVTFTAAGQTLCTAMLSNGAAACTTRVLPVGDYLVQASYSGDSDDVAQTATTTFEITQATTTGGFHFIIPPSVSITRPVNAARYTRGAVVRAAYSCKDGSDAPGLVSCKGNVARGAKIDTRHPGTHTFTVTGVSRSGESTIRTLHYVVYVPSNRIAVAQPRLRSDGTGTIGITAPGPGRLTAVATGWRIDQPAPRHGHATVLSKGSARVRRAGRATVGLRTTGSGRGLLRSATGHHLRVLLTIGFTPAGGAPRTVTKYGMLLVP